MLNIPTQTVNSIRTKWVKRSVFIALDFLSVLSVSKHIGVCVKCNRR